MEKGDSKTNLNIRIINFEAYKGRSDVKHNSWLRLSNRFLEDYEFFDFSFGEKIVWIYLLSIASQKNTSEIVLSYQHAHQVCNIDEKLLTSAIEKLTKIKCIEKIRTRTLRGRYAHDTHTCATDITDRHNITDITDITDITPDPCGSVRVTDQYDEFVSFWNSQNFGLSKVESLTKERKAKLRVRLKDAPLSEWKEVISKIGDSEFLCGKNNSGWKADFDWLIANETNRLKIIEGKYSSKAKNKVDMYAFLEKEESA
jgi:hypothetical protein